MKHTWNLVGKMLMCRYEDGTSTPFPINHVSPYLLERLGLAIAGDDTAKVERLVNLAIRKQNQATKPVSYAPVPASAVEPEVLQYLWEPYIPQGYFSLVYGERGSKKSWLAVWLTCQCTNGTLTGAPEKVHYWPTEDSQAEVRRRVDLNGGNIGNLSFGERPIKMLEGGIEPLEVNIVENELKLVIFDALRFFVHLESPRKLDDECWALGELARTTGCTLFGVHHPIKNAKGEGLDDMRGYGNLPDYLRSALKVVKINDDVSELQHRKESHKLWGKPLRYMVDKETEQFKWIAEGEEAA
jgi:hypothetical protein